MRFVKDSSVVISGWTSATCIELAVVNFVFEISKVF